MLNRRYGQPSSGIGPPHVSDLLLALNGLSLGRGDLSPDFYKGSKGIYRRIARQGISSYGHVHQRHFVHGRLRLSFHTYFHRFPFRSSGKTGLEA
ncbi:hypothetical protein FOVSG1_014281 [Fusarium oxysporum f. sp. vasinfectum]